jgi:hypothetical protein
MDSALKLNPTTLLEEGEEERALRQRATGVLGNGHTVVCFPNPDDFEIQQQQHRAVCLTRPYRTCQICPHALFTLVLREDSRQRYGVVACPRWTQKTDGDPDLYVPTEIATCESKPFDFCASCPSKEELHSTYSADKRRAGWYSRWKRLRDDEPDDE